MEGRLLITRVKIGFLLKSLLMILVKTGGPFQLVMFRDYWEKEMESRDNIEEATQI